jgi:hypothetical protein
MDLANRSVLLLATLHEFQGLPGFQGSVEDPSYTSGIESCICSGRIDFVFEEASELGPSTAEQRANSLLGPGHYLGIDSERDKPSPLTGLKPICGLTSVDVMKTMTREDVWLQRNVADAPGKDSAGLPNECIFMTVSGPNIQTWTVSVSYRREGSEIIFDKPIESQHDILNLLPGWTQNPIPS